jgi:hypothetical protein
VTPAAESFHGRRVTARCPEPKIALGCRRVDWERGSDRQDSGVVMPITTPADARGTEPAAYGNEITKNTAITPAKISDACDSKVVYVSRST